MTTGDSPARADDSVLRLILEPGPRAPSLARAAIAGFASEREIARSRLAALTLLLSELVTNAVMHSGAPAGSEIVVCARMLDDGAVRVAVTDRGTGFTPVPPDLARLDGGFGLYVVDQLALRWGVERGRGTRVWFELAG
jgi:anti-sigma regulatory factor (Ser/Thr protein kinase)